MDCDTTGVEPELALVKHKLLAGGGTMKLVNRTVELALKTLGYGVVADDVCNGDVSRYDQVAGIIHHIERHETIEDVGAGYGKESGLKPEHLPVFDCSFAPPQGGRSIHYLGHLRMMAVVQPWLSGSISKTANMPEDSTVADVKDAYIEAWKLGLKCVAIYRDGSKKSQPLTTKKADDPPVEVAAPVVSAGAYELEATEFASAGTLAVGEGGAVADALAAEFFKITDPADVEAPSRPAPRRERLPDTRRAVNHKFSVGGHEGYLNVGLYADGRPGELFVTMSKEGSTVGGLMDVVGTLVSMGLQYGVPLEVLVDKLSHVRFEPQGFTKNPDVPMAKSVVDYIFRWLGAEFVPGWREENCPNRAAVGEEPKAALPSPPTAAATPAPAGPRRRTSQADAPACLNCGAITIRAGSCYSCPTCGNSTGCA